LNLFLDTSILVAACLGDHPDHAASIALFRQCAPATAFCAAHSLAETYSTLTRIPPPHRVTAAEATRFLDTVCENLTPVSLESLEYREALRRAAVAGIVGGAIYDFLIAACARKAAAERRYTWNLKHYERFGPGLAQLPQSAV
jgi:predicted nucleic acid-binding protein